jgi:undecaprenyl-diphosphatase
LISRFAGLELHYDEAQYWEWSKQLDWSYYSKGPLIAWLIALSTGLFGDGEWQVRLPGWIVHGLFVAALFGYARDLHGERTAGGWAALIAFTTPLYFVLGVVMTTDNLLLLFWTLGLWAVHRALFGGRPRAWYTAGAAVGLGALTKLSIGLLPAFAGIALLLTPSLRHHLRNPHLWGGIALLFVCMAPVLYWNATHGYVMFLHEMGHVESSESTLDRTVEFLAGQIVALSPLMVALGVVALRRAPDTPALKLVWLLGIAWFGFFLLKSFGGKIQVNWAAICYVGFVALLGGRIAHLSRALRGLFAAGIVTSIVLSFLMLFPGSVGVHPSQFAPIKKLKGWREPIRSVAEQIGPVDFLLTESYVTAAEVAFYWPRRLPVYVMGSADRRHNQHDLWPGIAREQGRTAAVVQIDDVELPDIARSAFERCTALDPVVARDAGGTLRTYHAHRCENYRHVDWPKPGSY